MINRTIACLALAVIAAPAPAAWNMMLAEDTYEECIIEKMRGAKNDSVAVEIGRLCRKYQNRTATYASSGFFGSRTAQNCVLKNGEDIQSPLGARMLRAACYRTYPTE